MQHTIQQCTADTGNGAMEGLGRILYLADQNAAVPFWKGLFLLRRAAAAQAQTAGSESPARSERDVVAAAASSSPTGSDPHHQHPHQRRFSTAPNINSRSREGDGLQLLTQATQETEWAREQEKKKLQLKEAQRQKETQDETDKEETKPPEEGKEEDNDEVTDEEALRGMGVYLLRLAQRRTQEGHHSASRRTAAKKRESGPDEEQEQDPLAEEQDPLAPKFPYQHKVMHQPNISITGKLKGIKVLFAAAHLPYYQRSDPPAASHKRRGLLYLHYLESNDFSHKGEGISRLMDCRRQFRKYPGLALLRENATACKLLPPEPFPFSANPNQFNKDSIRKERLSKQPLIPDHLTRKQREDHAHQDFKKKRTVGSAHLSTVMARIEKRFEASTPKPTVATTISLLRSLDAFDQRMTDGSNEDLLVAEEQQQRECDRGGVSGKGQRLQSLQDFKKKKNANSSSLKKKFLLSKVGHQFY